MQRVLIADSSKMFGQGILKHLDKDFLVSICCDGRRVLRKIIDVDPDIIVLDMALPGCDGISLLQNLRAAGRTDKVVVISAALTIPVQQILSQLGVTYVFSKPCNIQNVVSFIRQLALGESGLSSWSMETELDNILLHLGFRCGLGGYECTYEAIRLRYVGQGGFITKCLYSDVRKICGKKSVEAVEKAIRYAIGGAWENGDRDIWELYFPGIKECPSNDVFVGRIFKALQNRERLKKPCKLEIAKQKEA